MKTDDHIAFIFRVKSKTSKKQAISRAVIPNKVTCRCNPEDRTSTFGFLRSTWYPDRLNRSRLAACGLQVSCLAYSWTVKMEAMRSSETSEDLYHRTAWCYNPEVSTLHSHRCENLKYNDFVLWFVILANSCWPNLTVIGVEAKG
jgi:hypothetical protein